MDNENKDAGEAVTPGTPEATSDAPADAGTPADGATDEKAAE